MAASNRPDAANTGNGRVEVETIYVDELAELETIGEDEIGVAVREGNVGGVEGVGKLNVKSMVGPEIGARKGRNNSDDLEEGRTVLAGDFGVRVHGLEEFQKDTWSERSHCRQNQGLE